MSFFILATGERQNSEWESLATTFRTLDRTDLSFPSMQLALFATSTNSAPTFHQAPNGDTIVVLGSLLSSGEPAPEVLPALLDRFEPGDFSWRDMLGTYIVIIYKGTSLHVLGDGLGASKIYTDAGCAVWSNSFLALCELGHPKHFDRQACYEYIANGSVFGTRTLVEGMTSLPANAILTIDANGRTWVDQRPSPIENEALDHLGTLDALADHHVAQLEKVFEPIAGNYGERIRLSFSGGFDSRLMLANLLKFGARPSLFVYGKEQDEDVQIARLICREEGLPLEVIDKSLVPAPEPDAFIGETEKNLFAFDGWKVETPLFDFGADRNDRARRHVEGQVPLNGGLGEIYRNFFYMPDRASSTGAVISTFYSRYDPRAFTAAFDEQRYRSAMAAAMREAIGADSDQLTRSQVEELYPKFRGRFWTGRDAQINQRFGPMFFPYLEPAAISNTAKVPIRHKDLGRLQGRIIGRINKRLAAYPSDYGFALDGPRPAKYRLKTFVGTQRPPGLRKLSFRMTQRAQEPRTGALSADYLSRVIDLEFPIMRTLFNMDAVNSSTQYGLIATLEYLAQRYNLQVSDD
jgi:asparagine synthase (glutamine-hydrolysing)